MFAISFLRMRNVVVLATLVFMFLGMEMLLLSVVSVPEACSATVPVTQIFHEQVSSFLEGSSLPIEVAVKDPAGVTGVRCYFRFDSSLPFIYSEMAGAENNVFTTQLPIAISTVQEIEYLFLVVNGQKQTILSPTFTLNKKSSTVHTPAVQNLVPEQYQLKSEVDGADTVKSFLLQPDNVQISLAPQQDHYGVLAGLYSKEQLDPEVVSGYFGAFRLDPKNGIVAVKGYIVTRRSSDHSLLQEKSAIAKETVVTKQVSSFNIPKDPSSVQVPFNIAGHLWSGRFWRSNAYARTVQPVTATVTQNADGRVTITTSLTGLGHYFEGNIYYNGHMLLDDAFDGEDWSTHDGPVTDLYIKIEDYIVPPSSVCDAPLDVIDFIPPDQCIDPPLNIIELKRSTNEKVPIEAISLLLLGDQNIANPPGTNEEGGKDAGPP